VPWFVAWLDHNGQPLPRGEGVPDFRIIAPGAVEEARDRGLCWICGDRMPQHMAYAFVVGPMCAVNRTSAEPPSHIICADWSARACPFLTKPHMERRQDRIPEDAEEPAGTMLRRNPGVALVWITKTAFAWSPPTGGMLFNIGEPLRTRWYAEGREATREEILESIDSGYPLLRDIAAEQGADALRELDRRTDEARELVPA